MEIEGWEGGRWMKRIRRSEARKDQWMWVRVHMRKEWVYGTGRLCEGAKE